MFVCHLNDATYDDTEIVCTGGRSKAWKITLQEKSTRKKDMVSKVRRPANHESGRTGNYQTWY